MVGLADRPDMTIAVYHGRKTITQQQQYFSVRISKKFEFSIWGCLIKLRQKMQTE